MRTLEQMMGVSSGLRSLLDGLDAREQEVIRERGFVEGCGWGQGSPGKTSFL